MSEDRIHSPHRALMIFCVGANHNSAPVALREAFHQTSDQLALSMPVLLAEYGRENKSGLQLQEVLALSTCNRFELVGVCAGTPGDAAIYDLFVRLQELAGRAFRRDGELTKVLQSLYIHVNEQAVHHMFRVAASLDSMVVGETQITGQFKAALSLAGSLHLIGPTLGRLGQDALAAAKKVRSQTAIGRKQVSISSAAIELAKRVFADLSQHVFLVLGAGEMARVAAQHILKHKPLELMVLNRTAERAVELCAEIGGGIGGSLAELSSALAKADVVISATGAPGLVIDRELLARVQKNRRGRTLFLIDIAMPRDIDPKAAELEDIFLFDIDDLQQVVGRNRDERESAAVQADEVVFAEVKDFMGWLAVHDVKPAIVNFRLYIDHLINREASKTLSREIFANLTEKQRSALTGMLSAVAGKMVGDVSTHMRSLVGSHQAFAAVHLLEELFPSQDRGEEQQHSGNTELKIKST